MTRRLVAVLAPPIGVSASSATDEPLFPPPDLRLAMVEDVYETVAALELVEPVLVVDEDPRSAPLADVVWPGTPVVRVAGSAGPPGSATAAALARLADLGADEATVVAGDAPDLPGLLIGKLHRGLGSADVAVLPADGRGLVALATRCPAPDWLAGCAVGLDTPDALAVLHAAAPRRTAVSVGPGWHRVRSVADLRRLDPGLEGWEMTRALLGR